MKIRGVFIFLLALSACAPERQTYTGSEHADIKTIALLPIADPEKYQIADLSANMFGLVGFGIERSINGPKEDQLTAEFAQMNYHLGKVLRDRLQTELEAMNYKVIRVDVDRPKPDEFLPDYSVVHTNADAICDVVIRTAGFSSPWGTYWPVEAIWVQMVRVPDRKVVYADHAVYGDAATATIQLDKQGGIVGFNTADQIVGQPEAVANVLNSTTVPIAHYFADKLK